jgi:putative RNA 2'-phosphotransferase
MSDHIRNTSKFLSLILRHNPGKIGLTLDENGWADVCELISRANEKGHSLDMALLERVVAENDKKRFSFNEDKTKLRANQGHSIKVDVELSPAIPPDILYHGTAERFIESIKKTGLVKGKRLHVHLLSDRETAINVGERHGNPVILEVDAIAMHKDGHIFYLSENGVWLAENVPLKYLHFEK